MPKSSSSRVIHTAQALVDEVVTVPRLPRRGLNTIARTHELAAGSAVNVLVAAARSGGRCVHAGSVGTGPYADIVVEALEADGITLSSPPVPELDTGVCIVLVEPSAERTFITTQGAERHISVDSLQTSRPVAGDWVCVSGYTLQGPTRDPLLTWLEGLPDGVLVCLDPGAALAEVDDDTRARILAVTDLWSSNALEAEELTGEADMTRSAPLVARALREGTTVVVRDGAAGCVVLVDGQLTPVPGYPQEPVDTNGAGDAHTGVLMAEMAAGADVLVAARRANAAGAIKVTRRGPATAPTSAEIDAFLADVGEPTA